MTLDLGQSHYFDTVVFTLQAEGGTLIDVSCSVRKAVFEPDVPIEERRTLCGVGQAAGQAKWELEVDYDQQWTDTGLSKVLADNVGKVADVKLVWSEGESTATGRVIVIPGPWGGEAGKVAEGTVKFPVLGKPTFGPASRQKRQATNTAAPTTLSTDGGEVKVKVDFADPLPAAVGARVILHKGKKDTNGPEVQSWADTYPAAKTYTFTCTIGKMAKSAAGDYHFRIYVDGEPMGRIDFKITAGN